MDEIILISEEVEQRFASLAQQVVDKITEGDMELELLLARATKSYETGHAKTRQEAFEAVLNRKSKLLEEYLDAKG